ncbi:transposase zinc-binding domain-containing protein [Serratia proteamaculans]|uniref:transposase zinc-binding domain-containing protein n=1 Tax=Serratia proteamaculans TaxID=28151 RepID=UPI002981F53F|nr:transposase zinc-binding domain-containing protein [Serratia proteamaculans]MDW5502509.1 transposase zinc-binding domain-containing protein [Serratia proteamaculans]
MYIPRPAKLLFQHDNGWSQYLDKHGDTLSDWTKLAVERMLACGICVMGVRRYCCASPDCTHARFFCQTCKSKACSTGRATVGAGYGDVTILLRPTAGDPAQRRANALPCRL